MPVVYDGGSGAGQGDLFKDLKLWISHNVPMRGSWVALVQNNGGQVVSLEKSADMLIADHVKRAGRVPPPGSYSYRWIEFSVKNGAQENKDDYLIGRPVGSSRNVGAAEQTKSGRTPFTHEDDLILTKWVLVNESIRSQGASATSIYKDLEKKYPHHTWQSWRERWVRVLRDRPRLHIPEEELRTLQATAANTAEVAATADPPCSPLRPPQHGVQDSNQMNEARRRPGRKFFTQEEDQMLIDYIREEAAGAKLGGNRFYQDFAEKHPSHSWHSWRDRWIRHLSLRQAENDERLGAGDTLIQPGASVHKDQKLLSMADAPSRSDYPAIARSPLAMNDDIQPPGAAEAANLAARPLVPAQPPNPKSDDERLKRQRQARKEASAAIRLQSLVGKHQAQLEAAFVPLQSLMRGYLLRMRRQTERLAEAMMAANGDGKVVNTEEGRQGAEFASQGMTHPEDLARKQFLSDLRDYLEVSESEVDMEPLIMGHRIDLWDLFRVSTQQECQPEDRDWRRVAEDLGLDAENTPAMITKVRDCFQDNLADFEEAIRAFEDQDDRTQDLEEEATPEESLPDETPEVLLTPDAMTAPKLPLPEVSSPAYQSSPPLVGSKRFRQHSELLASDLAYPSSPSKKRRRLDKNTVIPSTPEEKLISSRGQLRHSTPQDGLSPLKSRDLVEDETAEIRSSEESDELLEGEIQFSEAAEELPVRTPSRRKLDEPGTRDSPIGTGHERIDYDSTEEDEVSPSQQLLLESNAFDNPTPFASRSRVASTREQNANRVSPTSRKRATRADKSTPNFNAKHTANVVPGTVTSRTPVNGKATKRTLPPQYQRHDISGRNSIVQPPPQASLSTSGRPSGCPPISRTANKTMPTSELSSTYTPMNAGPASSRYPMFSASASPQISNRHQITGTPKTPSREELAMEAQFHHFQALGYSEDYITLAQDASTCQRGPMIVALGSLAHGRGIPENEPGVWSKRDVDELNMIRAYERRQEKGKEHAGTGGDGREKVRVWQARHRLESKHGKKMVEYRNKFLDMMGQ